MSAAALIACNVSDQQAINPESAQLKANPHVIETMAIFDWALQQICGDDDYVYTHKARELMRCTQTRSDKTSKALHELQTVLNSTCEHLENSGLNPNNANDILIRYRPKLVSLAKAMTQVMTDIAIATNMEKATCHPCFENVTEVHIALVHLIQRYLNAMSAHANAGRVEGTFLQEHIKIDTANWAELLRKLVKR